MDYYKLKLIRKLKAKSSEVQEELFGIESMLDQALPLFCEAVSRFCSENSKKNPLENLKDSPKEDTDIISDGIKSIFRKIALKTHPDKAKESDSSIHKYHDVTTAKKDKDVNKIISIAKDLKVEIHNISYTDIKIIENSIKKTQSKIQKITKSYPWVWYFASKSKRVKIIQEFVINQV